jgi:glycerol-3-phosphate acyltransferase PlsX
MMKIGIDILGGDFAPEATVKGAILAYKELPATTKLVLIGDRDKIIEISKSVGFDPSVFEIVHTTENIDMDEQPAKAFSAKSNASIPLGFQMLKAEEIDGFASAGSTGAMMIGAMMVIKTIPGILRACIASPIPNGTNIPTTLLDVGVNPDARADALCQYAVLGSLYAHYVSGIENPRVALMSIGSEEEKGNLVTKAVFQSLRESNVVNFVGNIEGHDLFSDEKADVIVCDGFVGNVILKEAEAIYHVTKKRGIIDPFFELFNFENYGGTPILGINSTAIIGHGASNDKAIKKMIIETSHVVESGLIEKIKEAFK